MSPGVDERIKLRFGENLKRSRRRNDLSQEELCHLASLHRTEISSLERGLRAPRFDTFLKLVCSLGVPPDDLLEGMSWRPGDFRPGRFDLDL